MLSLGKQLKGAPLLTIRLQATDLQPALNGQLSNSTRLTVPLLGSIQITGQPKKESFEVYPIVILTLTKLG